MKTGIRAFQIGLAAFIVPFMFYYSPELLLLSESSLAIAFATITALIGVYMLSAAVQAWFLGKKASWYSRILLLIAALLFMVSGLQTDFIVLGIVVLLVVIQKFFNESENIPTERSNQVNTG